MEQENRFVNQNHEHVPDSLGEGGDAAQQNSFASLLKKHMEEMGWGRDRLAGQTSISKPTISGWLTKGRIPRDVEDVLLVAMKLGLPADDVDALLKAASKPSLERLHTVYRDDPAKQKLLAPWLDELSRRQPAAEAQTEAGQKDEGFIVQVPTEPLLLSEESPAKKRFPWVRFALSGGVFILLLIGVLLVYTQNADAIPPQQPPVQAPEIMPDDTWTTVISETFDAGENDWMTGTDADQFGEATRMIDNGLYRFVIEAATERGFTWGGGNFFETPDIFYAAVDTRKASGARTSSCGLMIGAINNSNFHIFRIRDEEQHFSLTKVDDDTGWTPLVPWQYSPEIRINEVNRMAILVNDSHFSLLINDRLVQEWDDPAFRDGGVDVAVQAYPLDRVVCDFDNFELRVPPVQ